MSEQTFSAAFARVIELVADFQANENYYLSPKYQEPEARKEFIDKFWIALGWDVNHEKQKNPYEQEVKVERSVKTGEKGSERTKKADYAFFAAPNFRDVKFYVEAKKPARNLDNPDDYFQTIRYGWSSSTPLAVLTDFEQFRIIDCRYKPNIANALNFALKKFDYSEYADEEKFAEIYYLFSREAVLSGSLEKFAASLPKYGRGTKQAKLFATAIQQSVDESFLAELDEFRAKLASAFKNRNPDLDGDDLTEAVARTLDRLVFIRFLEDKLIEPETVIDKFNSWADFVSESARLNKIYNGIIFRHHAIIDANDFQPPEKTFTDICDALSPKDSPYDFNSIPIHILGSIYERFLGKTIEAGEKNATVVEKPEVRKAGGVYYTPEYIVRYICENTIGKLIAGKKPKEIAEMRFADIACGSGSFLIGIFDLLLRYHTEYYNRNKTNRQEGLRAGCIENKDGTLRLSLRQKKEILLNNIYGVDIDAQAVEVAQLSLFLKLLEDETTGSARGFQLEFRETMLPSLDKNIVHGNSLIDHDIDNGLFENKELRKLNPMSYEDKFPEIIRRGGFDAIVGNPPYVRQELLSSTVKNYFQKKYQTYHGVADLYVYFFEKYLSVLKQDGEFGIIVGSKWLRVKYGEPLRRFLKNKRIEEISDFGALPVFQGATTYPAIIRVRNAEAQATFQATEIETLDFSNTSLSEHIQERKISVNQDSLENGGWSLNNETSQILLDKLRKVGVPLKECVNGKIFYGIKTGANQAFVIDKETRARLIGEDAKSEEIIKPFLAGRDVKRYVSPQSDKFVIFTRRGINIKNYPAIENYLRQFYSQLLPKPQNWEKIKKKDEKWLGRKAGTYQWYEIQDTVDYFKMFEETKILFPGISAEVTAFAIDFNKYYGNDNNQLIVTDSKYLLGILNSRLSKFLLKSICDKVQGGFYRLKIIYIEQLPIRTINFSDDGEKAAHDKMVSLVEQMLETKKQLQAARTDRDKQFYQDRCNALDRQIDKLVYQLYGLSGDEIKIIES